MNIIKRIISSFSCVHENKTFVRNLGGDSQVHAGGRALWRCQDCGNVLVHKERHEPKSLVETLRDTVENDTNYDVRYSLVFQAIAQALAEGLEAGFRIDPEEAEWPVAFIELPTGQVSWHLPQHERGWDGHTTEDKFQRIASLK